MEVKKFSIILLGLLGGQCWAGIAIGTPKQSGLMYTTFRTLASCYGETVREVGIYGDTSEILYEILLSKGNIPVISINDRTLANNTLKKDTSRHKLRHFAIAANSSTQFKEMIEKLKSSRWWNHMASFLVMTWTAESENDCSQAFDSLWTAWQMNLLNVNFMCVNKTGEILLYTYNPYTTKAPDRWKLEKIFTKKIDHPWSMFVQHAKETEDICEGLYFDKTKDLGGWKIPSSAREREMFWHKNDKKTGIDGLEGIDGVLGQTIFRVMKAGVKLKMYQKYDTFVDTNDKGEIIAGVVLDVINKTSDIILTSYYQHLIQNLTLTYTHWDAGLGLITRNSGSLSQLSKINSVLDVTARYCLGVVILMTGQLASLLTKKVPKENIDTLRDLIESDHMVYGTKVYLTYLKHLIPWNRFRRLDSSDCIEIALHDPSAACVGDYDAFISIANLNPELHLSSSMIIEAPLVYAIREDWPLEERVNKVIANMISADIVKREFTKISDKTAAVRIFNEEMKNNEGPKVMTLEQLGFAFAILGIGLGFATAALIVETVRAYRYL